MTSHYVLDAIVWILGTAAAGLGLGWSGRYVSRKGRGRG